MTRQLDRAFWALCPFRQPRHRFRDGQGLALVGIGRTWERYWQTVRVANAWRPTLIDLARVGVELEIEAWTGEP